MIGKDKVKDMFFGYMSLGYNLKLAGERTKIDIDEKNTYEYVVESLKKGLGNCYEEAKLAELIAKINGQKNIYSAKLYAGKGLPKHELAFITDEKVCADKFYKFKNKEVNEYDTGPKFSEKPLFNNENKKIEKGKQKGIDRFQDKNPEQQRKIIDGQADTIKQYKEKLNNVKNKVDSDEGKGQREREIEFDR